MTISMIEAKELHRRLNAKEPLLLLDVRSPEAVAEWKIEANGQPLANIPYQEFLEENEAVYNELPHDREIVVVCARGRSALVVAEELERRGFAVTALAEGMRGWSGLYRPVTVHEDEQLKLIQLNRLAKGCLSYLVISGGEALVVDAGRHIEEYTALAAAENVQITQVLDTHLHADHISGGAALAAATGAHYYISSSEMQGAAGLAYQPLEQQGTLTVGAVEAKVLAIPTPGHTPGSVSVLVDGRFLLSGDTIFVGGLGRPDLGGKAKEWAQMLYDTVFTQVAALPAETLVLPTHFADPKEINDHGYVGAPLGEIRANNEVMRTVDREAFAEQVAGAAGATPPNYEQIVRINRGDVGVTAEEAADLETGPNRCAVHHS